MATKHEQRAAGRVAAKNTGTRSTKSLPGAAARAGAGKGDELSALANVGKAVRADFDLLGIESVAQLARQSADELYTRLSRLTGSRQDPCVWDTFAATIHQAKTGEARPWWTFTPIRKERQARGDFNL